MNPDAAFGPACPRQAFLETDSLAAALHRLEAGLGAREPFVLVSGVSGAGKTAFVDEALARWGDAVAAARVAFAALGGAERLEEIALRLGARPEAGASRPRLLASLEARLAELAAEGRTAIAVIDEAHALSAEALDELRQLALATRQSGHALEVWLVGLPTLAARLAEPALAPLAERIALRCELPPLGAADVRRYVHRRVDATGGDGATLFPDAACDAIAARAHGVPRRVNALAAEALRRAHVAGDAAVTAAHVEAAAHVLWGESAAPVPAGRVTAPLAPPPAAATLVTAKVEILAPEPAPARVMAPATPAASAKPEPAPATPSVSAKPAAAPARSARGARSGAAAAAPSADAPPASTPAPAAAEADAARPAAAKRAPRPAGATPSAMTPPPAPSTPPAPQDPREWVQRFVGDRGPVVIGAQAGARAALASARPFEPSDSPLAAGEALGSPVLAAAPAAPRAHRRRGRGARRAALALLATTAAVLVTVFAWRALRPAAPARTQTAVAAPTPSAPHAAVAASVPVVRTVPPPAPARTDSVARARIPSASGKYTLEIGAFTDLDEALRERDLAKSVTGLDGWVVPAESGSGKLHRVILGVYRSQERAESAARVVVGNRTLPRARAAALPPRRDRL